MEEIKQVIVMRTDLGMRRGKQIAQGGHSVMVFLVERVLAGLEAKWDAGTWAKNISSDELIWMKGHFTKITVRAKSEQELLDIHKQALDAGLMVRLITDCGKTEFRGVPTHTCLAIGPDRASRIDKITGHLELL